MFSATKPLPLTVPTAPGESATSFASRLARRNGVPRLITFCSDVGIDYFGLVNGAPIEVQRLAVLGGVDPVMLQAATPSLIEPGWFQLGKERIKFTGFVRTTLRICPLCLEEAPTKTGVIHQGIWQLASIRSCMQHGCHLVAVPKPKNANDCFDHIPMVEHFRPDRITLVEPEQLSLERYLLDRIQNGPTDTWLDHSPFHVAAQACEMLGLLLTKGPKARRSGLTNAQWAAAGTAGLGVLRGGPNGLRRKLRAIRDAHPIEDKLHRWHYGVFFEWLRYRDDDKDFDIFRNIVRDFIFKNFPIAAGAIVFGQPCPEQRLHSLTTAEKLYGVPHIRLGRKLAQLGYAKLEPSGRFYTLRRYIPVDVLNNISTELNTLVGAKEASKSIGIKYVLFERLADQGLIKRYFEDGQAKSFYQMKDAAEFIGHLRQLARRPEPDTEAVEIGVAARLRGVMIAPLTKFILERQVPLITTGSEPNSFREFRVCLKDLHGLKDRRREEIVASSEAATVLKVNRQTIYRLRDEGYLQVATERKGAWVRRGHYSTRKSLEEFKAAHVSLEELAEVSGRSLAAERAHRSSHGVVPLKLGNGCSEILKREDVD
ncbi:TniQ family protein [Falsirhodobacter deserti]|uniref:TniQ family protein n=1 Tax=Falsirhodobacter deserti TaxID=1365611 RepID=UPI000FE3446B|nr:TniQ family protein [Falsirhodobacter deserti]